MSFWTRRNWMTLAAAAGALAVVMGAFAAHGAPDDRTRELLRTGALYGFVHVLATFACAGAMLLGARGAGRAAAFFLAGVLLFSGSLYALAFGAPRWLGMVTPVGGLAFICGWLALAWSARSIDRT